MANNQYVNKVEFGGQTLIDLTDTTAGAADVRSGTYYHNKSGKLVEGTLIEEAADIQDTIDVAGGTIRDIEIIAKGSNGLEYEEGIWTPEEDISRDWILFANTHEEAPFAYYIIDAEGYSDTQYSCQVVTYFNYHQIAGIPVYLSSSTCKYAIITYSFRTTSETNLSSGYTQLDYPYTNQSENSSMYSRYWAKETGIRAYSNTTAAYWRADRSYKWIAIFRPKT